MRLICLIYRSTSYHRTSTDSYGETEHSHTSVDQKIMCVVVPDDHPGTLAMAKTYLQFYGGHANDPAFEFLGYGETLQVTAILNSPTTRL